MAMSCAGGLLIQINQAQWNLNIPMKNQPEHPLVMRPASSRPSCAMVIGLTPKRRKRCIAFTLVELMVVIGIIALLIGLLVPVLTRARRAADQTICLGNLRQWGVALTRYVNDNNGYLPRRGQGVHPTQVINLPTDWFNALPPTFGSTPYVDLAAQGKIVRPGYGRSIWLCPQATDMPGDYYWSYGMNMGLSVWVANVNDGFPDRINRIGDISILVFMADAPGAYCSVFPSMSAGGYNPVARHDKQVNICFVDGHAASFQGSYLGVGTGMIEHADVRWHPPGNPWNSAR